LARVRACSWSVSEIGGGRNRSENSNFVSLGLQELGDRISPSPATPITPQQILHIEACFFPRGRGTDWRAFCSVLVEREGWGMEEGGARIDVETTVSGLESIEKLAEVGVGDTGVLIRPIGKNMFAIGYAARQYIVIWSTSCSKQTLGRPSQKLLELKVCRRRPSGGECRSYASVHPTKSGGLWGGRLESEFLRICSSF